MRLPMRVVIKRKKASQWLADKWFEIMKHNLKERSKHECNRN